MNPIQTHLPSSNIVFPIPFCYVITNFAFLYLFLSLFYVPFFFCSLFDLSSSNTGIVLTCSFS